MTTVKVLKIHELARKDIKNQKVRETAQNNAVWFREFESRISILRIKFESAKPIMQAQ